MVMELFYDFFSATLGILAGLAVPSVASLVLGLIVLAISGIFNIVGDVFRTIKFKMKK